MRGRCNARGRMADARRRCNASGMAGARGRCNASGMTGASGGLNTMERRR